jgi:peptidoglycan/xylan/chitin deacetylase (PgdA/CDA1 family)/glycosyltransferase involved in cell wall biosynthesis
MTGSDAAVVITCFELGRTLPEAIESVLAQTAPAAEIVLVDDGSQDPLTLQVLAQLEASESPVRVIRSEHRGVAHARNLGIAATTAPRVVLLDGDDAFEPTYLEQTGGLLDERDDLSFVCCALQAFEGASFRWKPPAHTVADAIGRGACVHISTLFRRELWDQAGGFDETLPDYAYEDLDFWLRVLELGFRGVILDDALLRYRVRRGSRYERTLVGGHHVPAKELLIDGHFELAVGAGEDVFARMIEFQRDELTSHTRALDERRGYLEEQLESIEAEIGTISDCLAKRGLPVFDWGGLTAASAPQSDNTRAPNDIEPRLVEMARSELAPDIAPERALTIGAGDEWPFVQDRYDLIVIAGALERELDPAPCLRRCRQALRPGGQLVVAASTMPLSQSAARGFTETSIRALLCELFSPECVRVASYGNLMTCLGAVVGTQLIDLRSGEFDMSDPAYPTIVAGSAHLPAKEGFLRRSNRRGEPRGFDNARSPSRPRHGAILAYHRIADLSPDSHHLCTPPGAFATHMSLIAERFTPISLEDLAASVTVGEVAPGAVAVTFDDGYLDNLEIASPVLTELGIPATFFINRAAEAREGWWDTIERVLLGLARVPERLRLELGDRVLDLPTRDAEDRRIAMRALHDQFVNADPDRTSELAAAFATWSELDLPVRDSHRVMTADEVVQLSERPGHQIGAHGTNHLMLTVQTEDVRAAELLSCKAELELVTGSTVQALAYPYGGCDVDTAASAEAAGFTIACSVDPDPVTVESDPLRLPRLQVQGEDTHALQHMLERAFAASG